MKWLIASDLHGSAECCRMLLEAYEREEADGLLLLGDLLSPAMRRERDVVANMLNHVDGVVLAARGNCDTYGDEDLLDFPLEELFTLPLDGGRTLFATHGHIYNAATPPSNMARGDILLHGHTHVPQSANYGLYLCFNPGSIAQPRMGSERGYMTLEGNLFRWVTLDGEEYRTYEV